MNEWVIVLAVAALLTAGFAAYRSASRGTMPIPATGTPNGDRRYAENLEARIDTLTRQNDDLRQKVSDLERQARELAIALGQAREQLVQLSRELEQARRTIEVLEARGKDSATRPLKPLLHICAEPLNSGFCHSDAVALDRVHGPNGELLKYHRLVKATTKDVAMELQRKREEHACYWWLQISAHGSEAGIMLADGLADGPFWAENLYGVRGVLLGTCSNVAVADFFAGRVEFVVVVYEDVKDTLLAAFTHAFWEGIMELGEARGAYARAIEEVPQLASCTDLRTS